MILVDSSVWIDFFRGKTTPEVDLLDQMLGEDLVSIGDLMMTEVLQGFSNERDFNQAQRMLGALDLVEIGGRDVMVEAARYFRHLRSRGITIRKTIDTLIATRCIVSGHRLLYSDRDFDPFVDHLGLERAA
ncbi:PIN domain nuclease [Komagataeibacter xylinus]|uniref:Ribonuclease VapC n=1 Tax=Komagataeibacter xylinus TaxID=28448 RepID=A0A318PDV3_KOMXY|nr:PIN domain nuclease [Komagataeibacter xylinus]PYD55401.1 PIN domain nuclease [Komagataeibacter xylinus]GBQ78325.1 PilT protein domain-containing protein [Komagataeibacter xylinus NBRC 15237]